jgi:hypothetical protein
MTLYKNNICSCVAIGRAQQLAIGRGQQLTEPKAREQERQKLRRSNQSGGLPPSRYRANKKSKHILGIN